MHWMTTGSLEPSFVNISSSEVKIAVQLPELSTKCAEADTPGFDVLGEFALHRENLVRVFDEGQESLAPVLDALLKALAPPKPADQGLEDAEDTVPALAPGVADKGGVSGLRLPGISARTENLS